MTNHSSGSQGLGSELLEELELAGEEIIKAAFKLELWELNGDLPARRFVDTFYPACSHPRERALEPSVKHSGLVTT